MNKLTIIHLLSGGLDSTVLLHDLVHQGHMVHCLLVDYGQRHSQELLFAKSQCKMANVLFTTVSLPPLRGSTLTDGDGSVIVPARNACLLSVSVNLAEAARADVVTIGCNADDALMFPDCTPQFIAAFNQAIAVGGSQVKVHAPYASETKRSIAEIGKRLGVRFSETWSCYIGGPKPCGNCPACKLREQALG